MNVKDAMKHSLKSTQNMLEMYLSDLSDAELLVRPVPGANHIAWQLGHLLTSERNMVEEVCPGSMPALPVGFAEKYTADTAALDAPSAFHSKSVYMDLYERLRSGTVNAL